MRRRHSTKAVPVTADIVSALAALEAEDLRQIILGMLTEIDSRTHGQVVCSVIESATRRTSGWTPPSPSSAAVAEVIAFAEAAKREGYADPSDVDVGAPAESARGNTGGHKRLHVSLVDRKSRFTLLGKAKNKSQEVVGDVVERLLQRLPKPLRRTAGSRGRRGRLVGGIR